MIDCTAVATSRAASEQDAQVNLAYPVLRDSPPHLLPHATEPGGTKGGGLTQPKTYSFSKPLFDTAYGQLIRLRAAFPIGKDEAS